MKQLKVFTKIVVTAAFTIIMFILAQHVGNWWIGELKGTGGMVTATSIIGARYLFPIVVALIAGYVAYLMYFVNN